ncbi:MAG: hemolysin family protein, partial [Treponemataceae bacterium]|nr:hemolysin family protein [Treponemataceae bacterium]
VRAGRLLEKKEILINTLLVANDLVNILLSSIVTAVAMRMFGEKGVGIATFVVTLVLLVFGEITPKTISTRNPDGIAYALSLFVEVVVVILRPVVLVFTAVSRIVLRLRGISTARPKQSYTEEDIKSFIEAGEETGVLETGERTMMNRVFKFTDLEAHDIMVPRTSIVAVTEGVSYAELLELAQRTGFSSFPVYRNNVDDIVGVVYLKDLLAVDGGSPSDPFSVKSVMQPPLFIPGSKKMSSVQQVFRENRQSVAIVIDEYAGTDGLLTRADICREIFGMTEGNLPWRVSSPLAALKGRDGFTLSGAALLLDLKELTGIQLHSEINETLGGWLTEQLGKIAEPGDCVRAGGFSFSVESVCKRRVQEVRVEKIREDGQK